MSEPLAERMRPRSLEEYVGQEHLVGPDGVIRKMLESKRLSSFILWGPPGVGKTTLAGLVARTVGAPFHTLSAVSQGVKEVRDVIEQAGRERFFDGPPPVLFIDEIHRFSKSQQDSLLGAVEQGRITLIGATTENPSFEIIRPLLSRCRVYVLNPLGEEELLTLARRAIERDDVLRRYSFELRETEALVGLSGGDARKLLGTLELMLAGAVDGKVVIDNEGVKRELGENALGYDKLGDVHYDTISAFIKSIRGSDAQAAIYWLARMLEGGEDPRFIARRLVISASEDVGLANPNAMLLASAAARAAEHLGMPEVRIPLAEATIYLATSAKSNSAYLAIDKAMAEVRRSGNLPVPLHLRNATTSLMKQQGYGVGYKYPHDYPGHFTLQEYLPERLRGMEFWQPQDNVQEQKLRDLQQRRWGEQQ